MDLWTTVAKADAHVSAAHGASFGCVPANACKRFKQNKPIRLYFLPK